MKDFIQIRRRDLIVLIVTIVAAVAVFGAARADIATKRSMLREKAAAHEEEFFAGLDKSAYDHLLEVDSGKSNAVFGSDWGVVRLYSRKKGDTPMDSFTAIEYFYEHDGNGWRLADTARVDQPEDIYTGYRKFEEAGYAVDDQAYLRYNR